MNMSKTREKILEVLLNGGKVYAEDLEAITPKYNAEIKALKTEGQLNIRGFQESDSGRIFYTLGEVEKAEEGEGTPPDVRPPATSPPPAETKPAAPTSGASPAESPGIETSLALIMPSEITVSASLFTTKILPKSGRMKFEGYVEDKDEALDLSEFLLENSSENFDMILGIPEPVEDTAEAQKPPPVDPPAAEDQEPPEKPESGVQDAPKPGIDPLVSEDEVDLGWGEGEAPAEMKEVPILNDAGEVIAYRQVTEKPEKSAEDLRKEIGGSGLSGPAAAGMEGLLDKGPTKAPDSKI